jgi:hypothetical protein
VQIAEVVLEYINTLVWPVPVFGVVLVFRKPLAKLVREAERR